MATDDLLVGEGEQGGEMSVKIGDFVKVIAGPAFVPGQPIKGKVQSIDAESGAALVRVASGGEWGFMVRDLEALPRRAALKAEEGK